MGVRFCVPFWSLDINVCVLSMLDPAVICSCFSSINILELLLVNQVLMLANPRAQGYYLLLALFLDPAHVLINAL